MEIPVSFMVERLKKLPGKAFIVSDGSKVYAAVKDELVIFTGQPGEFNQMTEHQLRTFIRKNANKQGTPVEPTEPESTEFPEYKSGDWFEDVQRGETNVWEFQYDDDVLVWVNVTKPQGYTPSNRHVERPVFPRDAVREMPSYKPITPSQAADFILNDNNWGPGEEDDDGEEPSNSDS